MTQFKKKKDVSRLYCINHSNVIDKLPQLPCCHAWDDFWDFSRNSIPRDRKVVYRRLVWGSSRFFGNYLYIYNVIQFGAGIFINHYFLLSLAVLNLLWMVICAATEVEDFYKERREKEYIISLHDRLLLFVGLSHLVMTIFQFLKQIYLFSTIIMIFCMLHCCLRSVKKELVTTKTSFVASDGFVDEVDVGKEEITMIFTKSEETDSTLKHRSK